MSMHIVLRGNVDMTVNTDHKERLIENLVLNRIGPVDRAVVSIHSDRVLLVKAGQRQLYVNRRLQEVEEPV